MNCLDRLVVTSRVVFFVIVTKFVIVRFPKDVELFLFGWISYPVELHVHGLGQLLYDSVVDNTIDGGVISLDWCGWLWMMHLF